MPARARAAGPRSRPGRVSTSRARRLRIGEAVGTLSRTPVSSNSLARRGADQRPRRARPRRSGPRACAGRRTETAGRRRHRRRGRPGTRSYPPANTICVTRVSSHDLEIPRRRRAAARQSPRRAPARRGLPCAMPGGTVTHLHDQLDLDRGVQRQRRRRRRPSGRAAGVAEDLAEQLAGAVDHRRLAGESGARPRSRRP